jgi:signal transduction histidine kinase
MMNIINHLRTFSRQSQGEFSRLDINRIVRGAFTLISEQLRLHNIEVIEKHASDLPSIRGNSTQIEQVVLNLVTNARDAMDQGQGNSKCDDAIEKVLKISTSMARDNRHLEIKISDSGQGIPPEVLDRIFDPFFTTKEVGKGTGLGLSISYGIVEDHGGQIEVAETGPEGTTFRILLPIADGESEMGGAPS